MAEQKPVEGAADIISSGPIDKALKWIADKRLETPAVLFLEMHRPLMSFAWPAATMAGTFIAPFMGGPEYYEKIESLRDPRILDQILARLEEHSNVKHKAGAGS